jgi:hypothetical protein
MTDEEFLALVASIVFFQEVTLVLGQGRAEARRMRKRK